MDERDNTCYRPLTPAEQEAIKNAYRPYKDWPHIHVTYQRPTARQVIERYNRAHGQNPKITLRQICEQMNVNYASIRALKSRYAKQKKPKRS